MKSSRIPFILILFFALIMQPVVFATETDPGLTRGVEILYERDRLEKTGRPGEAMYFSHTDFLSCCGETELEGIVIRETPDVQDGSLLMGSETVEKGAFIPVELLDKLHFEPASANVKSASFQFALKERGISRCFSLHLENDDRGCSVAQDGTLTCYRNAGSFISCGEIRDGDRIEIVESPRLGLVRVEGASIFYAPGRDRIGTDRIRYRIVSGTGEKSAASVIRVQIKKAAKDLYFIDCKGSYMHSGAIAACEAGLLSYAVDETGLPVFQPEEGLSDREREAFLQYAAAYSQESDLPVSGEKQTFTRGEAAQWMTRILQLKDQSQRSRKIFAFSSFKAYISSSVTEPFTRLAYFKQRTVSDGRS